jgi:hypothetical protein
MVCYQFYCEFITSFHVHYNGTFLRPLSWCYEPKEREDGFIEFINRSARNYINTTFLAKYDFNNKNIIIRCEYNYFEHYEEISEVKFVLKGCKDNDYNFINIHQNMVCHLADEEILTFIKIFDQFYLEQTHIPLNESEYNFYILHLKNKPELTKQHKSKICNFIIDIYYNKIETGLVVRIKFYDKKNKFKDVIEYYIFKNRLVGDDFTDLDTNVNYEITNRLSEIYIDFITFSEFILK